MKQTAYYVMVNDEAFIRCRDVTEYLLKKRSQWLAKTASAEARDDVENIFNNVIEDFGVGHLRYVIQTEEEDGHRNDNRNRRGGRWGIT